MVAVSCFCDCCIAGITGVQRLLLRIGNIEANYDSLERRVQKIEKKYVPTAENKDLIKEGVGLYQKSVFVGPVGKDTDKMDISEKGITCKVYKQQTRLQ